LSTRPHHLDIEEIGEVTVAALLDSKILGETQITSIASELFAMVDEDGRRKIILNCSRVEYVASTALGTLITLEMKLKAANGKLRLCCVRQYIYEDLEIARCDRLFNIKPTLEEAMEGLPIRRCERSDG
jgi:anti-sigma B factor antagonist